MVGLTYFALSTALVVLLSAIGYVPEINPLASVPVYVALVLAGIAGWMIVREIRHDLYQLCTYWAFFGFIAAMGSLLLILSHHLLGFVFAGLSISAWIASVIVLVRARLAKDERPNELLRRFKREHVFEHAGVQIAVEVPDEAALISGVFDVRVFVQNCWDAERSVSIFLLPRKGLVQVPGGAEVAVPTDPLMLQGTEVGVLSIPVVVTTPSRVAIYVELRASGTGGRRIWRRPAQTIPMSISPIATLLLTIVSFGTHWVWGGGLIVRVPSGPRRVGGSMTLQRRWHRLTA